MAPAEEFSRSGAAKADDSEPDVEQARLKKDDFKEEEPSTSGKDEAKPADKDAGDKDNGDSAKKPERKQSFFGRLTSSSRPQEGSDKPAEEERKTGGFFSGFGRKKETPAKAGDGGSQSPGAGPSKEEEEDDEGDEGDEADPVRSSSDPASARTVPETTSTLRDSTERAVPPASEATPEKKNPGASGVESQPTTSILTAMRKPTLSTGAFDAVPQSERDVYTYFPDRMFLPGEKSGFADAAESIEEQGFYLEPKPKTTMAVQNRLERRLQHEKRDDVWFHKLTKDLNNVPNPVKSLPSRPSRRWNPNAEYLQTVPTVPNSGIGVVERAYRLDVDIGRMEYSSHPHQAQEDYLAGQLLESYREYKRREQSALGTFYADKLQALQENFLATRRVLRDGAFTAEGRLQGDQAAEEHRKLQARLDALREEVQETQQLRDSELALVSLSVRSMEETFRRIVEVRETNKFQTTNVQLEVQTVDSRSDAEAARFEAEVSYLVAQQEDHHASSHSRKTADYQAKKKLLEHQLKTLRGRISSDTDGPNPDIEALQRQLADLHPPSAASAVSTSERRSKAAQEVKAAKRQHDSRVPVLAASVSVDEKALPASEQARRNTLKRTRYFIQLYVNGREVGSTGDRALGTDFAMEFQDTFSLQLLRWPEECHIRVFEKGLVTNTLVSELYLTVPGADGVTLADVAPQRYQYTSQVPYNPPWHAEDLRKSQSSGAKTTPGVLYTSGAVYVQCKWVGHLGSQGAGDLEQGAPGGAAIAPLPPRLAARHSVAGAAGYVSKYQLSEWVKAPQVDPNDPRNAAMVELMKTREAQATAKDCFRLDVDDDLHFETTLTKRAQLLKARWQRSVHQSTQVPLLERDVDDRLLEKAAAAASADAVAAGLRRSGGAAPTEPELGVQASHDRQTALLQFVARVKANIDKLRRVGGGGGVSTEVVKLEDVVKDTPLPTFKLDLDFILTALEPRRKLRPRRVKSKVVTTHPTKCEVVVNIQKAYNLPVPMEIEGEADDEGAQQRRKFKKKFGIKSRRDKDDPEEQPSLPLLPFVEVSFQQNKRRTHQSTGANPLWNEQVVLPFRPNNGDYSPSSLLSTLDDIVITVFDEVLVDDEDQPRYERSSGAGADASDPSSTSTLRRYLGSLSVPVASVYRSKVVEGVFELKIPPVMLGYSYDTHHAPSLSVYIVLKPSIAVPNAPQSIYSGEDDALVRYAQKWQTETLAMKQCKARVVKTMGVNSQGHSMFLPRYISAVAPPAQLALPTIADMEQMEVQEKLKSSAVEPLKGEAYLRRLLRFVSLIPFDEDWIQFRRKEDVWTTCREMLDICSGDHEDHAVLLCNYFLHVGVEAYVLLGPGVNSPKAAFVLTKSQPQLGGLGRDGQPRIWSPATGRVYSVSDSKSELQEVGMVFNERNIWANTHARGEPWECSWDLTDAKAWKPFFSPAFPPRQLGTLQTSMNYEPLRDGGALFKELEAELEKDIMDAISTVRRRQYTPFNRRCSRVLKGLLKTLEDQMLASYSSASGPRAGARLDDDKDGDGSGPQLESLHSEALGQVANTYHVNGFPMHMLLTDKSVMKSTILNTHLANDFSEGVEFAVAAHVVSYNVNFVCSIWVYIATLRKRQ